MLVQFAALESKMRFESLLIARLRDLPSVVKLGLDSGIVFARRFLCGYSD